MPVSQFYLLRGDTIFDNESLTCYCSSHHLDHQAQHHHRQTCYCSREGDRGHCISGHLPYRSMIKAYRTCCIGKTTVPELLSGLVDHPFRQSPACHLQYTSHIQEGKVFCGIIEDFVSNLPPGSELQAHACEVSHHSEEADSNQPYLVEGTG